MTPKTDPDQPCGFCGCSVGEEPIIEPEGTYCSDGCMAADKSNQDD